MKIIKCPQCGKYLHETEQCFYCGNTKNFNHVEGKTSYIHDNVVDEYLRVESLIKNKEYDKAMMLTHKVVEWMPRFAGIFWLRLLAKNRCASAIDLIVKGFYCEEDPDFCNAINFSSDEEHNVYLEIQATERALYNELYRAVQEHECYCKKRTGILDMPQTMQKELEMWSKKFFDLWDDLKAMEQDMYIGEMDYNLLEKEHETSLNVASQESLSIQEQVNKRQECETAVSFGFEAKMNSVLIQSKQAKHSLDSMIKQFPRSSLELIQQRNEQVGRLESEIDTFRQYKDSIRSILEKIEDIEKRHRKVLRSIENYKFHDAYALFDTDHSYKVLHRAGINGRPSDDVLISIPAEKED